MESVRKLEAMMAEWFLKAPHMPVKGREWLAQNIWWISLVGVALGAFGILSVLAVTFGVSTIISIFGGPVGVVVGTLAFIAVLIALAFSIFVIVLLAIAIVPLKDGKKKGWDLLFISMLLSVASVVVGFLLTFNFGSLLFGAVSAAIFAYFLFEIRSYFKADRLEIRRGA